MPRVDASSPGIDAPLHPIDAPPAIDAAPMIDAEPHIDAPPVQPDAPACTPAVTEKLVNGNFDAGETGWVEAPISVGGTTYPIITQDPSGLAKQSGQWAAWLGGFTGDDAGTSTVTDSLYQSVTLAAGATTVVVSGYYLVGTMEDANIGAFDTFSLDVVNAQNQVLQHVLDLDNDDGGTGTTWLAFSVPITAPVAGQTVRLRATSTNDILYNTNFFLDSVSFKSTQCP